MAEAKITQIDPAVIQNPSLLQRAYQALGQWWGWFGPGQPLPQVAPKDTPPRTFDYSFSTNYNYIPRSTEGVSFDQLRNLADGYYLVRLAIETVKDRICSKPWQFRLKAQPGESKKKSRERSQQDPRVKAISQFFEYPDREHDFQTWLRMVLEDMLVLDAATLYPQKNNGGKLYALVPFDGATIHPIIDEKGMRPAPPIEAYQQVIKGTISGTFTAEELIYRPRNARTNRIYGFSGVEQIIIIINLALRRTMFQLNYYTEGSVPEAIAQVPDNWSADQIKQFQDWFDSTTAGDLAARRRIKFVPGLGGQNALTFPKEVALKDEMDEWLARVVCFAFSLPPTAFVKQLNRATAQQSQDTAEEEGIEPISDWVENLINYAVKSPALFNEPEVEFAWSDEPEVDQLKQAQIDEIYVRNALRAPNQIMERDGLDKVEGGDEPGFVTSTGFVPLSIAVASAKKALETPAPDPNGNEPPPKGEKKPANGADEKPPAQKVSKKKLESPSRQKYLGYSSQHAD
jgi:hypothetical protein